LRPTSPGLEARREKTLDASIPPPSEDLLENYALQRLNEEESATVCEHLLVCSDCQEELEELEEYGRAMKRETARLMPPSQPSKLRQFWTTVLTPTS